jgi:pilus assembly protein Flp/PilA
MTKDVAWKAATATRVRLGGWKDNTLRRIDARSQAGQTSVEYLGIIAVVVLIVLAIAGTNIGQTIYNAIKSQIATVAK